MRRGQQLHLSLLLTGIILLSLPWGGEAAEELGTPYIRNYAPEEFGAPAQNTAVIQSPGGITYFGNENGVLEFDGRNWALILLPNGSYVRSLAIDAGGTVYVGGVGEFGFLAADVSGKTCYVSLVPRLKKEDRAFNDIWKIHATSRGIYFLAIKKIFHLQDGRIEVIPVDLASRYGFAIGDELFIAQKGRGIFHVGDGLPRLLPQTETLALPEAGFVYMLPYREQQPLIIDGRGRFYIYDLGAFRDPGGEGYDFARQARPGSIMKPFPTEVSALIGESGNILYKGIPIPGGRYALATLKGGIIIMDDRGKLERVINRKHGLGDNLVGDLCLDREQNLWAALNTGLAYIAISSPISHFDEANGLEGYLIAVRHFRDRLFVGSFDGVFVLDERRPGLKGDKTLFSNIAPMVREGCDFLPLGDHLVVAAAPRLLLVDPELRTRTFGDATFLALCRSPRFPDVIFTGLSDGLGACRVQRVGDGTPSLVFYQDPFSAINDSIRLIDCDANGNLWLTTAFNGLIHIRFRGRGIQDYELTRYGLSDGLPGMDWNYVSFVDGRLLVSTQKGIYEGIPASPLPPGTPRTRFRPERTFGKTYLDPPARMSGIIKDGRGRWWVRSSLGIDVFSSNGEISRLLRRESFAPITVSEGMFELDEQGILWVPTNKRLYRFDPALQKDYLAPFPALIRQVRAGRDRTLFWGNYYDPRSQTGSVYTRLLRAQPEGMVPRLDYWENKLAFNFSSPYYEHAAAIRFQYYLDGFDKGWSEWTTQNLKEYTNLPEGSYAFRVKARNIYGSVSSEAAYRFMISPPWKRTPFAYALYALAALLLLFGIVKAYTIQLRHEQKRLEKLVALRTEELKRSNEELAKANNSLEQLSLTDALTQLPNRRNFELIFAQEWNRCVREPQPLSLLMIDIDFFKLFNDAYGHPQGDECLKKVAAAIKRSAPRAGDFPARIGGEEFIVILPHTPVAAAVKVAERVRSGVEALAIPHGGSTISPVVTITIGIATITPDREAASDDLLAAADQALYQAKKEGRNRFAVITI